MSADRAGLLRNEGGATALEFAIVLPVFVLMLLGGFQFGWAQHVSGSVGYALEKSARAMVLKPTMDQAAVQNLVNTYLDPGTASKVSVTLALSTGADGAQMAKITGVYTEQIGLPGLAAIPFRSTRVVTTPLPSI